MSRHIIMQAAMDGAVVMSVLTTGLLVFGRVRKPAARPSPARIRPAGPGQGGRLPDPASPSPWLAATAELTGRSSAARPYFPADDWDADDSDGDGWDGEGWDGEGWDGDGWDGDGWDGDPGPAAPSWLGVVGPLEDPGPPASPPAPPSAPAGAGTAGDTGQPMAANQGSATDQEPSWPDFLTLAGATEQATAASPPARSLGSRRPAKPDDAPREKDPRDVSRGYDAAHDHAEPAESGFSPTALRILGARPLRESGEDDRPAQRYQVALGDDKIEVVLTEAPAVGQASRPRSGNTWLAATPYLLWAPLPYDVPDDGLAFACVGAGDEGCLFIDLGAAPGAVAIGGDADSAVRLAESIAHQLCSRAAADQAISVLTVGRAIPEPRPASARPVPTLRDLAATSLDSPPDRTDIVFCELRTNEDAFVLARHVRGSRRRVVPVLLGHLPGAAWSFTAHPGYRLDGALPPLVSSLAGSSRP